MIEFSYKVILDDTGRIIPEEFLKGVHMPLSELEKTLIVAICEDSNKHLINNNDWCRMCTYFCSEWCYNYENPENCEDWRLCKYPIILLTDSPETIEHVHKLHRRILNKE